MNQNWSARFRENELTHDVLLAQVKQAVGALPLGLKGFDLAEALRMTSYLQPKKTAATEGLEQDYPQLARIDRAREIIDNHIERLTMLMTQDVRIDNSAALNREETNLRRALNGFGTTLHALSQAATRHEGEEVPSAYEVVNRDKFHAVITLGEATPAIISAISATMERTLPPPRAETPAR